MMQVKATVNIDIVSNKTGEVFEYYDEVWLGDFDDILMQTSKIYTVDRVERLGNSRTIWVQE